MQILYQKMFIASLCASFFLYPSAAHPEEDTTHHDHAKSVPVEVMIIITDNVDFPKGEYWPAASNAYHPYGHPLDTALVTIGDTTYNNIIESQDVIDNDSDTYLGYFINTQGTKVYLYSMHDVDEESKEENIEEIKEDY